MVGVLDTNHYVELIEGGPLSERLSQRVTEMDADILTTIITVQEITQGWLAVINRHKAGRQQMRGYAQFQHNIDAFARISILSFDDAAVGVLEGLQRQRLRVGTMDMKIAAICLAHDALLLTRNLADFEKVPELRVENWLD
jgi:tRNA(fMet)-specific endonuclease VapC